MLLNYLKIPLHSGNRNHHRCRRTLRLRDLLGHPFAGPRDTLIRSDCHIRSGVGILELFRWLGFVTYEFTLPYFKKGMVMIAGVPVDYQRLFMIGIGLALVLFLLLFYSLHARRVGIQRNRPE